MLRVLSKNLGPDVQLRVVRDLEREGVLFVQDGNHGEYRPRSHEYVERGVPFVRPPDLVGGRIDLSACDHINDEAFNRVRKGIGRGGDIVMTHNATIGRLAITDIDAPTFVTNPQTTVWRSLAPEVLDRRFLYFYMHSEAFQQQLLAHTGRNATFDYVSLTKQRGLVVPVPSIHEQRRVAAVLGALDDKIELNRKMNRTLEEMAQALFKSWFIDFDGHDPEGLVDSALGPIPPGWSAQPFEQAMTVVSGRTLEASDRSGGPTDVYGANGVIATTSNPPTFPACTVLGKIGSCGALHQSFMDCRISNNAFAVLPGTLIGLELVWHTLKRVDFRPLIAGSANPYMPLKNFGHLPVIVPDVQSQRRFEDFAEPLSKRRHANILHTATLAELRDTLLPKLISGEIRVPEAEDAVEAAL